MVGRVVVGCLGGRVRGVLVVDGVVCRGCGRLALLVGMARRRVCGGVSCRRRLLARWRQLSVVVVIIIVVNDNDLFRDAVPVEVGPVGIPPPLGRTRVGRAHVDGRGLCDGRELWRVSGVGSRVSAKV